MKRKAVGLFSLLLLTSFIAISSGLATQPGLEAPPENLEECRAIPLDTQRDDREPRSAASGGQSNSKDQAEPWWKTWPPLMISLVALLISFYTLISNRHWARYHYLANQWYEIIKIGLANPKFLDAEKTCRYKETFSDEELAKYSAYARICWAFLEDMHSLHFARMSYYRATIRETKTLHGAWLKDHGDFFTTSFVEFICKFKQDV